ncbi:Dolichyl-diphosphooligosaccharide--protein glycosyltransferase subunit [Sphaerulina musiva]
MPAKRNAQQSPATPLQQPATVPASSVTSSTTQPRTVTSKTFENKSVTSSKKASASLKDFPTILQGVWENYVQHTPQRVKLIDTFLGFLLVVGVLQFAYCVLAGNYPFNAFLSGFGATVGQFVLTASLRLQTNPENKAEFEGMSYERAFADFVFGSLILHFFCVNFIN